MKEIKIGKEKFNISCHAVTYVDYEEKFGRNIMEDVQIVRDFFNKQFTLATEKAKDKNKQFSEIEREIFNETKDELNNFIDCITKLCWICIYDNNKEIEEYDKWFSKLERLSLSDDWMAEVLSAVAECFL